MKNRFIGLITVIFPDGYVEDCIVKEKADKGRDHFIDVLKENVTKILEQCPDEENVKVKYKGDFAGEIHDGLFKRRDGGG